jgi:hypothetical protein
MLLQILGQRNRHRDKILENKLKYVVANIRPKK